MHICLGWSALSLALAGGEAASGERPPHRAFATVQTESSLMNRAASPWWHLLPLLLGTLRPAPGAVCTEPALCVSVGVAGNSSPHT